MAMQMPKQILIVDEEPARRGELIRLVQGLGCEPVASVSAADAIARLGEARFDLCIVDLGLPAEEGTAVIMKAHTCRPPVVAVALTTHGAGAGAVEALRVGVADLLRRLMTPAWARRPVSGAAVIGDHPKMQDLLDRVDQIADTDAAVLI